MQKYLLVMLMCVTTLTGCSSVPMITDVDLMTHQNNGDLHPFYSQLQEELKLAKPGSDVAENRQLYIEKTGQRIAEEKEAAILNGLDREFEKHSIATLQAALDKAADIRQFNESVYTGLRSQLEQAMSQKKGVILGKEAEYYERTDKDAIKKVQLLDEIAAIYGPGSDADQVNAQRSAYLDGLYRNAQEAMKNKRYEDAVLYIDNLEKIDPGFAGIGEMRHQLLAADYEQQFWDALEKGETDRAYATFHKLTQIPDYVQAHPDVVPIAEDMAQFFIAEGDQSMKAKDVTAAYQSYSRARYIRNVTNTADLYSPGEKQFVEFVGKQLETYVSKSLPVPAYGNMLIIQEIMPGHPSVMKYAQSLQDAVLAEATIKIIGMDFTENTLVNSRSASLVTKISQALAASMPGKIRLIDSKLAAASYMPVQIVTLPNPSSYLILSGEVLDVNVGKNEQVLSETKRVLTSYIKEVNPAYEAWLDLGKRKQKETPQPSPTIEKPVEEDVVVRKTVIEQKGIFSVTYRLADAVSASVVFSDTINQEQTYNYEDIPGVDAGLFVVEEKKAEVRTDDAVIEELSARLAESAAAEIARQVDTLQQNYLRKADSAVVMENFSEAAINYAYGYALSRTSENPDDEILAKFRTYALRWQ